MRLVDLFDANLSWKEWLLLIFVILVIVGSVLTVLLLPLRDAAKVLGR